MSPGFPPGTDPDFGEGDTSTEEDAAFLRRIDSDDSVESALLRRGSVRSVWSRLAALLDHQRSKKRSSAASRSVASVPAVEDAALLSDAPQIPAEQTLDAYKTALETRNFEIQLFWQRSNYFLVLNTAIGTGYFALGSDHHYAVLLAAFGIVISWLWLMVNLGSKFWQSRWEQQLEIVEAGLPQFAGFFKTDDELVKIVDAGLDRKGHRRWRGDRWAWYWAIKKRPSVSLMMTYLSVAFLGFWIAALALAIHRSWP